jgi:hypothetical protein
LKLTRLAAIATIIVAIIAIIQFFSTEKKSSLPGVPDVINKQKDEIKLDIDKEIYKGERSWLLAMYKAAKKIPYYNDQRDALIKVVRAGIVVQDFNIAIIAAREIPYYDSQRDALLEIVRAAVKDKAYFGYALLAAEKIPYYDSQSEALKMIVNAFDGELKKETQKKQPQESQKGNSSKDQPQTPKPNKRIHNATQ